MRVPSTIKRPPEKLISRAHAGQAGSDTLSTYLENGWSLGTACKACPRLVEWTPPDLLERFGDRLELKIADLGRRLSCSGPEGCGSQDMAVFPHPYDHHWHWPTET
jgi:hypothetical protein